MKLFVVKTTGGDVYFKATKRNRDAALALALAEVRAAIAAPQSEYDEDDRSLLAEIAGEPDTQWALMREWEVILVAKTQKRKKTAKAK